MNTARSDRAWPLLTTLAVVGILVFWAIYTVIQVQGQIDLESADAVPPHTEAAVLAAGGTLHPVHVRRPAGPPRVSVVDPASEQVRTVSCTTCHATREGDPRHGRTKALVAFHTEIGFVHGKGALGCLGCHNADDYDTLRGADGQAIAYPDVMQLCAQCHGRQYQSYLHGAHGGMNGYWDRSRGARTRNTCTDCHDPHAPAFPSMKPTFKPIDRGLEPADVKGH